jgi:predicted DNA-binding transcriptional regulator AlpA
VSELLTAQEVASIVRVHYETFQRWCRAGLGPRPTRIRHVVRYAASDVHAWIRARQETSERV